MSQIIAFLLLLILAVLLFGAEAVKGGLGLGLFIALALSVWWVHCAQLHKHLIINIFLLSPTQRLTRTSSPTGRLLLDRHGKSPWSCLEP